MFASCLILILFLAIFVLSNSCNITRLLAHFTMVLKKYYQAIEDTVFIEAEGLQTNPSFYIGEGNLKKLGSLPKEILNETKSFIKRNSLAVVAYKIENHKPLHCCCSRCLKARLMRKCDELGMKDKPSVSIHSPKHGQVKEHKKIISEIFDCETGHDGYYLDGSKLFKN